MTETDGAMYAARILKPVLAGPAGPAGTAPRQRARIKARPAALRALPAAIPSDPAPLPGRERELETIRAVLLAGAEAALRDGLELARTAYDPRIAGFALANLSQLKPKRRGDAGAAGFAAEALRLARTHGYRRAVRYVAAVAALLSRQRGDLATAARLLAAVDGRSGWGPIASLAYHDPAAYEVLRAREHAGAAVYRGVAHPGRQRQTASSPALSEREHAILRMISEGLRNKQIATALGIAERTVRWYVSSAMNKLGVDNRAHAAVTAVQRGLL